jgi:hypothetical protein
MVFGVVASSRMVLQVAGEGPVPDQGRVGGVNGGQMGGGRQQAGEASQEEGVTAGGGHRQGSPA